ncbi:MAG: cytochrome P460 family protein, partial [Gemmatimonadota bacterium]
DFRLLEAHVKKADVHESGWGFYVFGPNDESAAISAPDAPCYSCHSENADFDNNFSQFYPKLRQRLAASSSSD